jgi:hypothetical protein
MPGAVATYDRIDRHSILVAGQRTVTVTIPIARVSWDGALAVAHANARASGGTTPTLMVDLVVHGGSSLLDAAIDVTAGEWTAGVMAADPSVSEGDQIDAVLTIGGTNPTWDDIAISFELQRTW